MNLQHLFTWGGSWMGYPNPALDSLFPVPVDEDKFIAIDVQNIFTRILTAVLERTEGLPEEMQLFLWDNCLGSERSDGLVTLLSKAMAARGELYLIYDKTLSLVREASATERDEIKEAYKNGTESKGVFLTFKNFAKADMVKLYSALEYLTIGGLWKQMNLSTAIQFKMGDLRKSVSATDSEKIEKAAAAIVAAIKAGKNVLVDKEDVIELLKPDLNATQTAIDFIAGKLSFYLGLPAAWITGESKKSMGDTGEGMARELEQGLRPYFFQVIKPVCKALFEKEVTFKSSDFRWMGTALTALKDFDATSEQFISVENKTKIINRLFHLGENEVGTEEAPAQLPPPTPAPPTV